ncbi:MAG: hypothetical protein J6I56_03200 [Lachnospiraceae bacterium]|nr:hypothetical protein [Lachnospiraceae bacterium]
MIALEINNIASFMSRLLSGEMFDSFLLEEAVIRMSVTWTLDGHLNEKNSAEDGSASVRSLRELVPWRDVRPHCYGLIRGKVMPHAFRFVLHAGDEMKAALLSNADGSEGASFLRAMLFNVLYDGETLRVVTGISYNAFTVDKSPEGIWDAMVRRFLEQADISYTEL